MQSFTQAGSALDKPKVAGYPQSSTKQVKSSVTTMFLYRTNGIRNIREQCLRMSARCMYYWYFHRLYGAHDG